METYWTGTGLPVTMMMMMLVISPTDQTILCPPNLPESFQVGERGLGVTAEDELDEMKKIREKEIEKMPYPTPRDVREANITTDHPPEEVPPSEPTPRNTAWRTLDLQEPPILCGPHKSH